MDNKKDTPVYMYQGLHVPIMMYLIVLNLPVMIRMTPHNQKAPIEDHSYLGHDRKHAFPRISCHTLIRALDIWLSKRIWQSHSATCLLWSHCKQHYSWHPNSTIQWSLHFKNTCLGRIPAAEYGLKLNVFFFFMERSLCWKYK